MKRKMTRLAFGAKWEVGRAAVEAEAERVRREERATAPKPVAVRFRRSRRFTSGVLVHIEHLVGDQQGLGVLLPAGHAVGGVRATEEVEAEGEFFLFGGAAEEQAVGE